MRREGIQGARPAGATGTLSNAQCTLSAAAIAIAESGTTRTVTLTLSFSAAFAGPTVVNMKATDQGGALLRLDSGGHLVRGTDQPHRDDPHLHLP